MMLEVSIRSAQESGRPVWHNRIPFLPFPPFSSRGEKSKVCSVNPPDVCRAEYFVRRRDGSGLTCSTAATQQLWRTRDPVNNENFSKTKLQYMYTKSVEATQ